MFLPRCARRLLDFEIFLSFIVIVISNILIFLNNPAELYILLYYTRCANVCVIFNVVLFDFFDVLLWRICAIAARNVSRILNTSPTFSSLSVVL